MSSAQDTRRNFIKKMAILAGGAVMVSPFLLAKSILNSEDKEEEISPNEDLMREHGVLRRIILIYREIIHRLQDKKDFDPRLITKSGSLIKHFIEDYHEKLEENFLFPRFEKAGQFMELVDTLKSQHKAGKKLTKQIIEISISKNVKSHRKNLVDFISQFIRMYEPHAAREDTILFPAFQKIVSENEYKEMGEKFEDEEHKLFGRNGFNEIVAQIADIEKALNIYDLRQFTPK